MSTSGSIPAARAAPNPEAVAPAILAARATLRAPHHRFGAQCAAAYLLSRQSVCAFYSSGGRQHLLGESHSQIKRNPNDADNKPKAPKVEPKVAPTYTEQQQQPWDARRRSSRDPGAGILF